MEKKTNTFLFSIITFLNTCFRWKKTLIYVVFATAIITSIIMLIVPKTFTSYAQIYPTRGQQIQGINSNIGSFIASGLIGSADSDIG
ncbi:MAG: Wzz/FepE/Etk N-terminal domain-containing protein, partial [Candidatus Marinimicrobia bacterium]|nr:Wzz/FepE/Etk N-terminal domain-containing protein [Candidatus Neomarinimicrobiota bacterium]